MNTNQPAEHRHTLSLKIYLGVGAALLVLTAATVAISFVPLGPYNLVVALSIATVKAILVAFFFMHLLYDNKFYLFIYSCALATLGVFIIFTLFDTMRRGDINASVVAPIQEEAIIYQEAKPDTAAQQVSPEH